MGSSSFSWKFVFHNHPSLVLLSVMDSAQSPSCKRFAMMSTQGVITAARCSSKLLDAQNLRLMGILNRHANPS
jgi:hypothetical protein